MLDYFQLLQDRRRFFEYKAYHKELGLIITIICMIGFFFAFPIWFVQLTNICKKTTTQERFGFKKGFTLINSYGTLTGMQDVSDTFLTHKSKGF